MNALTKLFDEIRTAKLELARADPRRGMPLLPPPGASERAIASVEKKLGRALPEAYRSFLAKHDGWPELVFGASLLGTKHLLRGTYVDLARLMFENDREAGAWTLPRGIVPFGIDAKAEVIFAFDLSAETGDVGIVALVSGVGQRFATFEEFLAFTAEALEADAHDARASSARSRAPASSAPASAPRAKKLVA